MSSDRRYTQDEVDAILKRALEREGAKKVGGDALSHQDLLETAREVGIEPGQIEAAIAEVKLDNEKLALREEWLERRRAGFRGNLVSWVSVGAMLTLVNLLMGGAIWFPWAVVPWGLMVFLQYRAIQNGPSPQELERLERRLQRERRKRELEERFTRGAQALGTVVEEGARLLAAHLDERARRLDADRHGNRPDRLPPKR